MKKVHGVVSRVSGREELAAMLGALIEEKGIHKVVRWDTHVLSELDDALTGAGAQVVSINIDEDESRRPDQRNVLIDADLGLTEVDYAVADIGSLVMRASGPQSRLASVLPPIHVAVVGTEKNRSFAGPFAASFEVLGLLAVRRIPRHRPLAHRRYRDHSDNRDPRTNGAARHHPRRWLNAYVNIVDDVDEITPTRYMRPTALSECPTPGQWTDNGDQI